MKGTTKKWSFRKRAFYLLVRVVIPRFIRKYFNLEVNGLENVFPFPEGTPVIFCANHQSNLDSFIVAGAAARPYGPRRFISLMASGKAMYANKGTAFIEYLGAFPVFRGNSEPAFRYSIKTLKEGLALFIAPQGKRVHRTIFDDYLNLEKEGESGVGRIVLRMNGEVPVIPVYLHGSANALQRGKFIPRFKSYISVNFGKALSFNHYYKNGGWKIDDPEFIIKAKEIANEIMTAIKKQLVKTEYYYIKYLEWKFDAPIEKIYDKIPRSKRDSFNKLLRKLEKVHPNQFKEYLQKKGVINSIINQ